MRLVRNIFRYLGLAAGIIFLASVHSCVIEIDGGRNLDAPLMVQPSVSGSTPTKTTVADDPGQKENDLISLDVFVKGVTVPDFWKTYHLTVAANNLQEAVDNLLSRNWREDVDDSGSRHYVEGDKYDVYAVANSDLTSGTVASFSALCGLRENEFSSACVWNDGTINPAALNLHKTYVDASVFDVTTGTNQQKRAFTNAKKFVMDGVVHDWSPVGGIQVIPMTLERAASKFEVNVSFSDDFLQDLASDGKTITGQPGWRFVNFAYDAPLINPNNYPGGSVSEAEHVLDAGALILGNASFDATDHYRFTINTYSYPRKWDLADAVNEAPALVVSVGYMENNVTQYTYYRIPLVDQNTTNTIGRNMFYRVNAVIESSGSTSLDDLAGTVVDYEVIPWNDASHSGTQPSDVEYNERLYLQVTPHTYTLRGDGPQSVDLTYKVPTGKHIKIQYFTTQENNEAVAAGNTVSNSGTAYSNNPQSPAAYYYNKSGTYRTKFKNANVQVSITDNNPTGDIDKGTITVSSTSLANKAIKHIVFRVYLDVDGWYAKGLYRDIYIRHFPTDNIQGIPGSWSSRVALDASGNVITEPDYSFYPKDGYTAESGTFYWTYAEYSSSQNSGGTYIVRTEETLGETLNNYYQYNDWSHNFFYNNYTWPTSEANAVLYNGYYYWRTSRTTGNGWGARTYYTFHRARYSSTARYVDSSGKPSTGNWVDWENDRVGSNGATSSKTVSDSNFRAKVYTSFNNYGTTVSYCVPIVSNNNSGGRYYYTNGGSSGYTILTNNYMYVIQIAETNPTYKLGRPELDANYQTDDHVVSPAFMIASQLGAVSPYGSNEADGKSAAAHCGTYMEVAQDGTRYVGWRLPTAEEIGVIIKYQGTSPDSVLIDGVEITNNDDRVLTPVLTGSYYWTSNIKTGPVETGYTVDPTNDAYVRCVRDMLPEEIKALNKE